MVALLPNGKKTAIVLGSHALYGDGLELAGRIAAKTGADILGETTASRFARGEGRVSVRLIPYLTPRGSRPVPLMVISLAFSGMACAKQS